MQIIKCKEFIRIEQSRTLRMIDKQKELIKTMEAEFKFMEKCREEINEANKLLRTIKI